MHVVLKVVLTVLLSKASDAANFTVEFSSKKYWCQTIKNSLLKRFSNALFAEERYRQYDLRQSISMKALFLRLKDHCDITFIEDAEEYIFDYDEDTRIRRVF